jgi:hypothetical protein
MSYPLQIIKLHSTNMKLVCFISIFSSYVVLNKLSHIKMCPSAQRRFVQLEISKIKQFLCVIPTLKRLD